MKFLKKNIPFFVSLLLIILIFGYISINKPPIDVGSGVYIDIYGYPFGMLSYSYADGGVSINDNDILNFKSKPSYYNYGYSLLPIGLMVNIFITIILSFIVQIFWNKVIKNKGIKK